MLIEMSQHLAAVAAALLIGCAGTTPDDAGSALDAVAPEDGGRPSPFCPATCQATCEAGRRSCGDSPECDSCEPICGLGERPGDWNFGYCSLGVYHDDMWRSPCAISRCVHRAYLPDGGPPAIPDAGIDGGQDFRCAGCAVACAADGRSAECVGEGTPEFPCSSCRLQCELDGVVHPSRPPVCLDGGVPGCGWETAGWNPVCWRGPVPLP